MEISIKTITIIVLSLIVLAVVIVSIFVVQSQAKSNEGQYRDIINGTVSSASSMIGATGKVILEVESRSSG